MMSAGYAHNPSNEVATGQINRDLLSELAARTGGTDLTDDPSTLSLNGDAAPRGRELWPWLLFAFLPLFLADVLIRRWENWQGMLEMLPRR